MKKRCGFLGESGRFYEVKGDFVEAPPINEIGPYGPEFYCGCKRKKPVCRRIRACMLSEPPADKATVVRRLREAIAGESSREVVS